MAVRRRKGKPAERLSWWAAVNSPLVIALLTGAGGVAAAVAVALHSRAQEVAKDNIARRATLTALLVEYRKRLSALEEADSELGLPEIVEGVARPPVSKLTESERLVFERKADEVVKRQREIIQGSGSYVPTSPAYANLNVQAIEAQIDEVAGIPPVQSGGLQLLGLLNFDVSTLWLWVHGALPQMRTFYVGRQMLLINGELPLDRGLQLTPRQERVLGFPQATPGDLEKLQKENDERHERLQRVLRRAEGEDTEPRK